MKDFQHLTPMILVLLLILTASENLPACGTEPAATTSAVASTPADADTESAVKSTLGTAKSKADKIADTESSVQSTPGKAQSKGDQDDDTESSVQSTRGIEQRTRGKDADAEASTVKAPSCTAKPPQTRTTACDQTDSLYRVDTEYANKIFKSIDSRVRNDFFDSESSSKLWPIIASKHKAAILAATNLKELSERINAALSELKVSHTQFVTINDETFYFLKNLFDDFKPEAEKQKTPLTEYLGLGLGGVGFKANQVRYVLTASPAAIGGVKRGDIVLSANGKPIIGLLSFRGTAGATIKMQVLRADKTLTLNVKPIKQNYYQAYLEASSKSARIINTPAGPLGYIRLWCGGKSGEILEEAMSEQMADTAAMIIDLRDGYGGNSLEDLDIFYRLPSGYPVFRTHDRKGNVSVNRLVYTKPLIALINGGSRSGKELLAFSLKNSKRGILVGERTSGAVLAGRLFPIDDRCALYLAVMDGTIGGKRLEGVGVRPDVQAKYPPLSNEDMQLKAAINTISTMLHKPANPAVNAKVRH